MSLFSRKILKNYIEFILMCIFPVITWYCIFDLFANTNYIILSYITSLSTLVYLIYIFFLHIFEQIEDKLKKRIPLWEMLMHLLKAITWLALIFAGYYWCIYYFNNDSFINVIEGDFFEKYFDFIYYSIGIITTAGNSEIIAKTFLAKFTTIIEMVTTFIFIVFLIANYKEIGNPFNYKKK